MLNMTNKNIMLPYKLKIAHNTYKYYKTVLQTGQPN